MKFAHHYNLTAKPVIPVAAVGEINLRSRATIILSPDTNYSDYLGLKAEARPCRSVSVQA